MRGIFNRGEAYLTWIKKSGQVQESSLRSLGALANPEGESGREDTIGYGKQPHIGLWPSLALLQACRFQMESQHRNGLPVPRKPIAVLGEDFFLIPDSLEDKPVNLHWQLPPILPMLGYCRDDLLIYQWMSPPRP